MASSYRFVVSGRVQGVGFRYSVANEARRLGLSGWVRNREDGAVEGLAQGTADSLEQLRAWLQRGPRAAEVEAVAWTPSDEAPHAGFAIRA